MTPEDILSGNIEIYQPLEIVINLLIASVLGIILSSVYKITHKGLSYSQSFMITIVLVTVIVSMVMMVIGNNLVRAFALVGAMSIIRFRTVIKDTKDTSFIFLGLASGMAAGTSSYFLAFSGIIVISALILILHSTNYGSIYKSEFILRFRAEKNSSEESLKVLEKYTKYYNLLHVESSGDLKGSNLLTYDILLKDKTVDNFMQTLKDIKGLTEIKFIASKTDVDY